jgi:hypothetical protein
LHSIGPRYDGASVLDLLPENIIRSLSAGLGVLTSMITPALLISASGTFILSTSQRLGRVIDRVRKLTEQMEQMMNTNEDLELIEERRDVVFDMIDRQSIRARLLSRALMVFYIATGMFVATSVAIGLTSLLGPAKYVWVPVLLGIGGASLLFVGSVMLIAEARLAVNSLRVETAFLRKLVDHHYRKRLPPS